MEIETIRRYIRDAQQAYKVAVAKLGVGDTNSDLAVLLNAARRHEIHRRGIVTDQDGCTYEYRIHGSGYSFKDLASGKEIHFDVTLVDGECCIRFSVWEVYKYASSSGDPLSEETVGPELKRLSLGEESLVHVVEGASDYYHWREEP
jgi:hypothetical protein